MIEVNFRPEAKDLRIFSILLIPFALFLGWVIQHYWDRGALVWSLAGTLATIGVIGVIRPEFVRWLFVGWMVVAFPIGWTVSHLVLALVYYGMFLPVGLIARGFGYDPLQLRPTDKTSYWLDLNTADSKEQYFRQF